jgi:mannose-6-phosphate isomerase-like protein (cupin superfamily)
MSEVQAIVLGPGEGTAVLRPAGQATTIKASAEQTGGAFAILEAVEPTGAAGPPLHIHHDNQEVFYILDGTLTIRIGEETVTASAGSFVLVPRETRHTFKNPGTEPAKFLIFVSPGGYEGFFAEMAELFKNAGGQPPEFPVIAATAAKYGQEFVGPPLP